MHLSSAFPKYLGWILTISSQSCREVSRCGTETLSERSPASSALLAKYSTVTWGGTPGRSVFVTERGPLPPAGPASRDPRPDGRPGPAALTWQRMEPPCPAGTASASRRRLRPGERSRARPAPCGLRLERGGARLRAARPGQAGQGGSAPGSVPRGETSRGDGPEGLRRAVAGVQPAHGP